MAMAAEQVAQPLSVRKHEAKTMAQNETAMCFHWEELCVQKEGENDTGIVAFVAERLVKLLSKA